MVPPLWDPVLFSPTTLSQKQGPCQDHDSYADGRLTKGPQALGSGVPRRAATESGRPAGGDAAVHRHVAIAAATWSIALVIVF